jgi:hypothetical protein
VRQHVDETRSNGEAGCINNRVRAGFRQSANFHNAIAAHGNVQVAWLSARAVVNGSSLNQHVERLRLCKTASARQQHGYENEDFMKSRHWVVFPFPGTSRAALGAAINVLAIGSTRGQGDDRGRLYPSGRVLPGGT